MNEKFLQICATVLSYYYCLKQPLQAEHFMSKLEKIADQEEATRTSQKKLTIAIISPGNFSVPPVIGSSVEHDIEMVSKVMQENHHVVVYTRKCSEYSVTSREGNLDYRRFSYRTPRYYLRQVVKDLARLKPDIIQVENRPKYVPLIKKKNPLTPIILNMHSMQFASSPWIESRQAKRVMRIIAALITNSQYLEREYIKKFPLLKGKAFGIHLGIDPSPYIRAKAEMFKVNKMKNKFGIGKEEKVLLFVGRIKKEKGVHHLINAMPKVMKKNKNVKLLIAGSPKYGNVQATSYLKNLQQKAKALNRKVVFTKFISPFKMPYIYELADVVITPSVWGEPFCRVNLEAMSAGKPIVTTKRGGIPEVVKKDENGYVLSLKNISKTLPKALTMILESDEQRRKLGNAGLKRVQQFTWQKTSDEYLSIYRKVLKGKR